MGRGSLYDVTSCVAAWSHGPSGLSLSLVPCSFQEVSVCGSMSGGGLFPGGISVGRPPPRIRKADGRHHTGLLSCYLFLFGAR